jgi:hypothetical protein
MSFFVVDVEADGPTPGKYSMHLFGAVLVEPGLKRDFRAELAPISDIWSAEALAVSGYTREQVLKFNDPTKEMLRFRDWLLANSRGRPIFITDNLAFDWQFINYYFHMFVGANPFGFSGRRIGDLYCGLVKNARSNWKHLRRTKHTHDPVDDARGNAEAILYMRDKMGLRIDLD